jgi:hypothetical protein
MAMAPGGLPVADFPGRSRNFVDVRELFGPKEAIGCVLAFFSKCCLIQIEKELKTNDEWFDRCPQALVIYSLHPVNVQHVSPFPSYCLLCFRATIRPIFFRSSMTEFAKNQTFRFRAA